MLRSPTTAGLVRGRWLLEHAESLARDTSDPGRHLALIALDGAVEYALWLVVNTTGARVKGERPNFGDLIGAVRQHLDQMGRPWAETGHAGVDQLRRARNPAQHAGVAVDADQLPGWADAARAYIDSLWQAAFDTPLADLVLALSVSDDALRERLTRAERALDQGEPEIAFSLAWTAFERALNRWRETRHGAPASLIDVPAAVFPRPDDELRRRITTVEQLLDVSPFASDLGEFVSLSRSRVEQETTAWVPEMQDARRALRFATGWIVRWEVFEHGYPAERWDKFQGAIEPPTLGLDHPSVVEASAFVVRTAAGNTRWLVRAQIADIPERGRGDWGIDLAQCVTDALQQASDGGVRMQRLTFSRPGGVLAVEFDPDVDADAIGTALGRAVELADQRYRGRSARRAETERRRMLREEQWRAAIDDRAAGMLRLRAITTDQRADDVHFVAELSVGEGSDVEVLTAAELLRSRGGWLANAGAHNGVVLVEAVDLTGEIGETVRDGLATAAKEIARQRDLRDLEHERFADFAKRLDALWAGC